MQTMLKTLERAERSGVERVEFSRDGLSRLAGLEVRGQPMSAELVDAAGKLCGRARRAADPASSRFSDGYVWHVQIGGTLVEGEWSGRPMGCGCGSSPLAAALDARADLMRRACELERQAERVSEMLR